MDYKKSKIGFLTYSNIEIRDILKAWLAISIAFGIVFGGLTTKFLTSFIVSAVAVGLGFLLHELSHKVVAQKYNYKAEFRSFDEMLFLAIIMSFFGFVIAAPGAVMIQTKFYDKSKNGKISVAGPLMNLILAGLFLILLIILTGSFSSVLTMKSLGISRILELPLLQSTLLIGFLVNSWLALFNMVPFWMFDGAKIFKWNKIIWGIVTLIAFAFVFLL